MNYRFLVSLGVLAALLTLPAAGQAPASKSVPSSKADLKKSSIPRGPDGHPDLQGIWTNATLTSLERPAQFANKPTVSDAEAAVFEKQSADTNTADKRSDNAEQDRDHAYNSLFFDRGSELARVDGQKRTSLIVDPADGHIPSLNGGGRGGRGGRNNAAAAAATAAAQAPADEGSRGGGMGRYDKVQDRPLAERCLLGFGSTSGPPMLPVLYNNNYQIVQTPDNIMILVEMDHDVRTVRMNAKHAPDSIHQWLGDSIGHWEGDTLVVETTSFNPAVRFRGSSEHLKVTERFTRIDGGTILYKFTIDDPSVFSKPWTAEYPFLATKGPLFEYACHEGNYAMPDILGGARLEDKKAEGKH